MTQTMRERLIAAAAQKLQAYDFGYDEAREGSGAEIVDAILAELREPDDRMLASIIADLGATDDAPTRQLYRDVVQVAVDHLTGDGIDLERAAKPYIGETALDAMPPSPELSWGKE